MPKRLWRELAEVPRKLFKTPPPLGEVREALGYDKKTGRNDKPTGLWLAFVPEFGDTYDQWPGGPNRYWAIQEGGYKGEHDQEGRFDQFGNNRPAKYYRSPEEAATALHDLFDDDDDWQAYASRLESL